MKPIMKSSSQFTLNQSVADNEDLYLQHRSHYTFADQENAIFMDRSKPYRLTPFIVTFSDGTLTSIDIQNFIEMGLHIVRFKMTHVTMNDKIKLIAMLNSAVKWCCEKYEVSTWPIAISVDVPNACIRTGYLSDDIEESHIRLKVNATIEVTSRINYWNKCDAKKIFIDDPFTIKLIIPGTELSINFGEIVMICTERLQSDTIKCIITTEGMLGSNQFICIRGIKKLRPALTGKDLEVIEFAKEFKADILTMNSVRYATTLKRVKKLFAGTHKPLIMSTICEQEGLDNIDAIIEESDGIILAREFLANEIVNNHHMTAIQLQISAKCRMMGKPFYLSGNILEQTLRSGYVSICDLSDVTNAVLQGSGFVFRSYNHPNHLLKAIKVLDSICRYSEPLARENDFWRMSLEWKMPVNAAEACILATALTAMQIYAPVVILLTATGRTAVQLTNIFPDSVILAITTKPDIARKLLLYRGIIPVVYDKKHKRDWLEDMIERVQFGVNYGIKHDLLKYGNYYVILQKSTPHSAFCDNVSIWRVETKETFKKSFGNIMKCDEMK